MEHDLPRDVQSDPPVAVAGDGHRQQRGHNGVHQPPGPPQLLIHFPPQQRLRVHVEVVGQQRAQAQAEVLDGPAFAGGGIAKELFDHQQSRQGETEPEDGDAVVVECRLR